MATHRPRPALYDIIGLPIFVFLIIVTGWSLLSGNPIPRSIVGLLFIISIFGIITDGWNVYGTYFKK